MPAAPDLKRPISDDEISEASRLVSRVAIRTPLIPFPDSGAGGLWLKPENLQPLGSFKIRCAFNAASALDESDLARGLATASAGNFAQGLARAARELGADLTVHAPETAARTKLRSIERLGARIRLHSFDRWWEILCARNAGDDAGAFIHPVAERGVLAGNATIGAEILQDLPDADVIFVPFGGGGLGCGVAMAAKRRRPGVKIVAVESEAATPLSAAFEAGKPVAVEKRPCFIDGMGSARVLDEMWPLLRELIDDVAIVSLAEVRRAVFDLAVLGRMVAEGAGASALAAARLPRYAGSKRVALISGGNLDRRVLNEILDEFREGDE